MSKCTVYVDDAPVQMLSYSPTTTCSGNPASSHLARLLAGAVPSSPRLAPPTTQRRPLPTQALSLVGVVIGCSYIPGPRSRADLWTRNAIQRSKAGRTLHIPPTSFLETRLSWGGESWTWTGGSHLPVVLDSVVPAWIFCTSSGCVIFISTSTKSSAPVASAYPYILGYDRHLILPHSPLSLLGASLSRRHSDKGISGDADNSCGGDGAVCTQ